MNKDATLQRSVRKVWKNQRLVDSILPRLKTCSALSEGKRLHDQIIKCGLGRDKLVGNQLVHMYGNCGALTEARAAFDDLPTKNVFSWNILIGAYVHQGYLQEAIELFEQMPERDIVSWNEIITGYAQRGQLREALKLFQKMPERSVVTWNTMITAYGQQGQLNEASELFEQMPQRNMASWNAMLSVYIQHGKMKAAFELFEKMPNKNVISWTAMVAGYAQKSQMKEALKLFDQMPQRDVISWNAILAAYTQHGQLEEALEFLKKMPKQDVSSWNILITAYARLGQVEEAHLLFQEMPERNVMSWNSLITAYVQQGKLEKAQQLFLEMPQKDVVTWNTMLSGYAQQGMLKETLHLFHRMRMGLMKPNKISFISALDACANQAALAEGKQVHACIIADKFESEMVVGNALVNMYGKCGRLDDALKVFDNMDRRDALSWSARISAQAHSGCAEEAIEDFQYMKLQGVNPDQITVVSVLSACSHAGFVDEGYHFLAYLTVEHNILPMLEHYNCMIDLLGRAGRLDEAEDLINSMSFEPRSTSWRTLLASSRTYAKLSL